jgi:hypothetical protein
MRSNLRPLELIDIRKGGTRLDVAFFRGNVCNYPIEFFKLDIVV